MPKPHTLIPLILASCCLISPAATPVELGKVAWLRDYDKGIAASTRSGKPIFLLFQEVPG
jgi:hypothetical protein